MSWAAGVSNRSTFNEVVGETAMKLLITYNHTSLATTANGRLRNGDLAASMGVTILVADDQGRGSPVTRSFANGNCLDILTKTLAPIAGGDFSLIRTGAAEWVFEFHPGQLGLDKTSGQDRVEFSKLRGNMTRVRYRKRRRGTATVAIVGGQSQGAGRTYEIVHGDDYAVGNDIEMYVDARNETGSSGLVSTGVANLKAKRPTKELNFQVVQTPTVFYGPSVVGRKTYSLGDLVSAVYADDEHARKITAVSVTVRVPGSDSMVQVGVETEDV